MIFNMQLSDEASLAELSDIRVGVDDTVYPSAGDAVRGQITDVKEDLTEFEDGFHNLNLFIHDAELLYEDGYAIIDNGKISVKQPNNLDNAYLLPVDGQSIYSFTECRFAFLVDSDKETAIGNLLTYVTQIDSTGASYICFSINKNDFPLGTYQISKGETLQTGFELPQWTDDIVNEINTVDNNLYDLQYDLGANLFNRAELIKENGYAQIIDGHIGYQNLSNYNAYLLPVDGQSKYNFTFCRFAFLVDSDKYTAIGSLLQNVTEIDSTGASYICFSFNTSDYSLSTYEIYGKKAANISKQAFDSVTGNIDNNTGLYIADAKTNLRKGLRLIFEGDITSFSALKMGLAFSTDITNTSNHINSIVIDGTTINYYVTSSSTPVSVSHGLTITNNIQIIWETSDIGTLKISLISNGHRFETTFTNYYPRSIGFPFVLSTGTVLTGCKLTWACTDINKKLWFFGDSYIQYDPERWAYYLHEYGYDNNCLIDGFPGEGGTNGRVSYNNLLNYGTPKFAVWCLGMNDGSDSSTAPSADWVTQRDYFLDYCTRENVEPIFATIPTVPSINHEQKNAWVKSSGYRYIDFAKAVGANSSGVWYSGMLSSDNVHPTEAGAKALFARALLDLPELMVDDLDY